MVDLRIGIGIGRKPDHFLSQLTASELMFAPALQSLLLDVRPINIDGLTLLKEFARDSQVPAQDVPHRCKRCEL